MKRKFEKYRIPEWAIMYLYYGDTEQVTAKEIEEIENWKKENNILSLEEVSEESGFSWYPEFGEACNVTECVFSVEG